MRRFKALVLAFTVGGLLVYYNSCSKSNDGSQTLKATIGGNPNNRDIAYKFSAFSAMEIQSLSICLDDLILEGANSTVITREFEDVIVLQSGTTLGNAEIPHGTYSAVSIELSGECASGKSVVVTNSHGTFSTADEIELRFEGSFSTATQDVLLMKLQTIADSLKDVQSDSEIKGAIESDVGDL